jgi:hypothetical protein
MVKKYKMLNSTDYRGIGDNGTHGVKIIVNISGDDWAYGNFTETTEDFILVDNSELMELDIESYFISTVPSSISRRQAKQQLAVDGHLSRIQPMIDAIPDMEARLLMQIYWDDSTEFDRNHTTLIQFATALGLDSDQIDLMFINASKR